MTFYFIIRASSADGSVLFIQFTDPMVWNDDITKAKRYDTELAAKSDIELYNRAFIDVINYTDYKNIRIVKIQSQ